MFQYKIIHNIFPTKVSLFKAKICDDDICPQCLADRHSLDHMLLRCQLTVSFWNLFQTWWTSKTKENVTLTENMILYGIFDNREHLYSLNYSLFIEGLDGGGGGGYKCQLSVKILAICQLSVKFKAICQLSVNWLLIIN